MKKWECSVCGYIHECEEPPDTCPVCGADKDKFVLLKETKITDTTPEETIITGNKTVSKPDSWFEDLIVKHHIHPISVHFPNGIIPVSFVFILFSTFYDFIYLTQAAFYNLVAVLITMPIVLVSGYISWKKKYYGAITFNFILKIFCGISATILLIMLVSWYVINPSITLPHSNHRWIFSLFNLVLLLIVGIAGFIGGKLVFRDKKQ